MTANIIAALSVFGTFGTKPKKSSSQAVDPKTSFAKKAVEEIALLSKGEKKGYWFETLADGQIVVSVRRGIHKMAIDGVNNSLTCPNAVMAVNYINAVAKLVAEGQLDAVLEAAKPIVDPAKPRKQRVSKKLAASN